MNKASVFIGFLAVLVFVAFQSAFIVGQTEQTLVLQFGKPVRTLEEPGLYFKMPLIQNLVTYDKRLLEFNARPEEINMVDDKRGIQERVVVDAFVKYRITNPLLFYQSVRNELNLNEQLRSIIFSSVREVLGKSSLRDLLSDQRVKIMHDIRTEVNRRLLRSARQTAEDIEDEVIAEEAIEKGFGINVVDVRINRADLPEEISQSTFNRMRANFAEEAQKFRSQGQEEGLKIRSNAERMQAEIVAAANQKAQTIKGEAEGIATKIYADAFGRDPEFFDFYRSLQAYKKTIQGEDTTVIMSPDNKFLKHIE
jgi:membrane protease subunit HflC